MKVKAANQSKKIKHDPKGENKEKSEDTVVGKERHQGDYLCGRTHNQHNRKSKNLEKRVSLMVQWIRSLLPVQGPWSGPCPGRFHMLWSTETRATTTEPMCCDC